MTKPKSIDSAFEFILDHSMHFGYMPGDVELKDGTVFTFNEYYPLLTENEKTAISYLIAFHERS